MADHKITKVWAREVLDSRGNPTVEAEIQHVDRQGHGHRAIRRVHRHA